jgi:hypothetical protein
MKAPRVSVYFRVTRPGGRRPYLKPVSPTAVSNPRSALHQHLAAKLADACVNPSYMPDLWAVYFNRFEEVLASEPTRREPRLPRRADVAPPIPTGVA